MLHQKEEHSSVHSEMKGEVSILEERLQSRKDEISRLEETLRKERDENRALSVEKLSQVGFYWIDPASNNKQLHNHWIILINCLSVPKELANG